jgi:hypothetical protein
MLMLLTIACSGCGTLIPGPRYKVTLEDFAFNYDGSGVLYLEDDYRFYPLLFEQREDRYLYLYDRETAKHRRIAETEAFSVSPYGPYILYAPPWKERFRERVRVPDFYLLNYKTGVRKGYRLPAAFDKNYLSYGFPYVQWKDGGALIARVNFHYAPGEEPRNWSRLREKPADWHTMMYEVRIVPEGDEEGVAEARAVEPFLLPDVSWHEIRRRKFVSPDGERELVFTKYNDYLDFNSELAIVSRGSGQKEYIVKKNLLIGVAQACTYSFYYMMIAPLLGLNELFFR